MGRLTKFLTVLREELVKDPTALTKEASLLRDAINKREAIVGKYFEQVITTCDSMHRITSSFEKQLEEQELKKREHVNRAQEIKAHIRRLESELDAVEREYSHEKLLMEHTSCNLDAHRQRNELVTTVRGQLELLSSQDRDRLDKTDKLLDSIKPDESGLSARARSLRYFLMACPT